MQPHELESLCTEITAFLRQNAQTSTDSDPVTRGLAFWRSRAIITIAEMEVLTLLAKEAHNATFVAHHLGCELAATQRLLDAFVAVGLAERHSEQYRASEPVKLYLWALREGRLPAKE
jgi:DNA-binding MarR family transcriptional regulator